MSPLTDEFIYLAQSAECAGPIAVKGIELIKKWNWWNYNILTFLCIFGGFWYVLSFFVECLPNLAAVPELPNWSGHLTKRSPVAATIPLARILSFGHWYTGVYLRICDPAPRNLTTFLGPIKSLTGVPAFNSTERRLTSLFMIRFWDYGKEGVIFDEIYVP